MLTDRQRLAKLLKAESLLKQTKAGYAPDRPLWKRAMPLLWEVRLSLKGQASGLALADAHGLLKKTEKGYDPRGARWRDAMFLIDSVEAELAPTPGPNLGPIIVGGKPVLLESPTHNTDGLLDSPNVPTGNGSEFPAFDFGWKAGLSIIAWETFEVMGQSSAMGADAFYGLGIESRMPFWLGHITSSPGDGQVVKRGQAFTKIAAIPGADHGHLGIDARPLIGRDLRWGRNGTGPDYTFGSPTIGQQLTKALAT